MKSEPIHRTNILPLRWLVNYILHPISMWFFDISLKANFRIYEHDEKTKWNYFLEWFGHIFYEFFGKPYYKWGTTYRVTDWKLNDE